MWPRDAQIEFDPPAADSDGIMKRTTFPSLGWLVGIPRRWQGVGGLKGEMGSLEV